MKHAFILFGMGGYRLDPRNGEELFTSRAKQAGFNVHASPYNPNDLQKIADVISQIRDDEDINLVGDSEGANNLPLIAKAVKRHIHFAGGFQPSLYCAHVLLPSNIDVAICINSNAILTLGLGAYTWKLEEGNSHTQLHCYTKNDFHPGDDDVSLQGLFLHEMMKDG